MHVFIKKNYLLFERRLVFVDCLPKLPAEVFVSVQGGINTIWEINKNPLYKPTGFYQSCSYSSQYGIHGIRSYTLM